MFLLVISILVLFGCHEDYVCPSCPPPADTLYILSNPIWSKDGKKIFGFGGTKGYIGTELYEADTSGGEARRLLRDSLSKDALSLSPDGIQLSYAGAPYGSLLCCAHVYVFRLGDSVAIDLTPAGGNWNNIRWSPDSKYLIFDGLVQQDTTGMFLQIVRVDVQTGQTRVLTSGHYNNRDASYLFNGNKIAFSSGRIRVTDGGKVWVMDANGSNQVPIDTSQEASLTPRPSPARNELNFVWSPFSQIDGGFYAVNLDSVLLPASPSSFRFVSNSISQFMKWSPDGENVVYATGDITMDLFLLSRDGTIKRQLTAGIDVSWPADWSPDSKQLVFLADLKTNNPSMYDYDLSTNILRKLIVKPPH
jgi:Tol biopolymer transport system component